MRYIESTKRLVTVGNSVGVTLGIEADKLQKRTRDEIGVVVFEPELMEDVVARLENDRRYRYFITVRKESSIPETDVVYDMSASNIRIGRGEFFAILGPFDDLRSCIKFKRRIDREEPGNTPEDYQNAYYEFVTD